MKIKFLSLLLYMLCVKLFRDNQTFQVIFEYVGTFWKVRLGLKRKNIFRFPRNARFRFYKIVLSFCSAHLLVSCAYFFGNEYFSEYNWENFKKTFSRQSTKIPCNPNIFCQNGLFVSHDDDKFCHVNKKLKEMSTFVNFCENFCHVREHFCHFRHFLIFS
jgi:hypothetical protein